MNMNTYRFNDVERAAFNSTHESRMSALMSREKQEEVGTFTTNFMGQKVMASNITDLSNALVEIAVGTEITVDV